MHLCGNLCIGLTLFPKQNVNKSGTTRERERASVSGKRCIRVGVKERDTPPCPNTISRAFTGT